MRALIICVNEHGTFLSAYMKCCFLALYISCLFAVVLHNKFETLDLKHYDKYEENRTKRIVLCKK